MPIAPVEWVTTLNERVRRRHVIGVGRIGFVFGDGTVLSHDNDQDQFVSVLEGETGQELARAPLQTITSRMDLYSVTLVPATSTEFIQQDNQNTYTWRRTFEGLVQAGGAIEVTTVGRVTEGSLTLEVTMNQETAETLTRLATTPLDSLYRVRLDHQPLELRDLSAKKAEPKDITPRWAPIG